MPGRGYGYGYEYGYGGGAGNMAQITDMIQTIISEMGNGNFSFLILVVGIAQLIVMVRNGRRQNNTISPKSGEKGVDDEI